MISAFANTWKIPELRDRILFTLALIVIVRLGVHITLPGVDATVIKAWLDSVAKQDASNPSGGMTALLTVFSGGGPLTPLRPCTTDRSTTMMTTKTRIFLVKSFITAVRLPPEN